MHALRRFLISGLLLLVPCKAFAQSTLNPELPWSRFKWVGVDIGSRHFSRGAIAVPIAIDGLDTVFYLQHDLGANGTMLYEVPYRQVLQKAGRTAVLNSIIQIDATIANCHVSNLKAYIRMGYGDPIAPEDKTPQLGTLGLDFFTKRILLIDYRSQKMAILQSDSPLPTEMEKQASFVPIKLRNNKLFIPITLNGKEYPDDFFFDTGASLFPLATTKMLWQILTGRQGDEKGNEIWHLPSWGKEATLIGAPLKEDIRIGNAIISNPNIFFSDSGLPNLDFEKSYQARGLFGNALFVDHYLVIVDIPHSRFGLISLPESIPRQ